MNQNWIVENLNNAFSTWNGKLGELWGLVTTGPQTFKGGAVWSVMQTLHNGMVGIGYALVVLFFAISLCKNTMNFHELKRPEAAIHSMWKKHCSDSQRSSFDSSFHPLSDKRKQPTESLPTA